MLAVGKGSGDGEVDWVADVCVGRKSKHTVRQSPNALSSSVSTSSAPSTVTSKLRAKEAPSDTKSVSCVCACATVG